MDVREKNLKIGAKNVVFQRFALVVESFFAEWRDVDDVLTVSDAQLVTAMRFFAERMKMVVEPTGCLGFAAVCEAGQALADKRVGVIISGGNVDLKLFAELVG